MYKLINGNAIEKQKGRDTLKVILFLNTRFSPAECICVKQMKPDGTIDKSARLVIDLENKKLSW
jgi:hypothetical protein